MPVFRREKLIFIHIPKTAGTSVENAIKRKYKCLLNAFTFWGTVHQVSHSLHHCTYNEIVDIVCNKKISSIHYQGLENIEKFRIFTIVRNPYDRFVSEYRYMLHVYKQKYFQHADVKADFAYFVRKCFNENKIRKDSSDNHITPQYIFIEGCTNVHIMKFENLDADFESYFGFKLLQQR